VLLPDQNYVISSNAEMKLAGIPIKDGLVELYLPQGNGTAGKVHIDDYTLSEQAKRIGIGSFPFDGSIGLDFAYHRAELPVHISVPNAFTLGEGGPPVEGDVTLLTNNSHSLDVGHVHVAVPDAFLGPLEVTGLFFDYQREHNVWSGGANFLFPGGGGLYAAPPPPDQGFGVRDGHLDHIGATLVFPEPLELFPGIGLTHIGFTFGLDPTRFSGNAGLNALDIVNVDGSLIGAFASPGAPYTIHGDEGPGLEPAAGKKLTSTSFAAGGAVSLITPVGDIALGQGYFLYQYPDTAEFAGSFFYGFHDILSIDGHIDGFVQVSKKRFNVEGGMHVCVAVLGCTGVDAVVSSNGIAACWTQDITFIHIHVGVGYHWGDSLPDIYLLGCDVGPYKATAAAAQANGPRSFTLAAGLPFATVRVRGSGGAPRITLTGPHGEKLVTPANADTYADAHFALVRQPQTGTTFIGIKQPAAGIWTVTADSGSAPVLAVDSADGLAAPNVHARVSGRGAQRTLHYHVKPEPGQQVSFVERGPASWRVLGQATSSTGQLRFSPASGATGSREIVALIDHAGLPSRQLPVARFSVAAPGPPRQLAHLRASRHGSALAIRWAPNRTALRNAITISLGDGRRLLFLRPARIHALNVPNVPPTTSAVVRVAGLDSVNRAGGAATVRLARKRPPKPASTPRLRV
jgi:hypothetical protein